MELNEKQKIKVLREKTIELLKDIPEGKRAHIDKDMLEKLLFDEVVYNKNTNESFKLPVWTGDFLKKIDLSEISFEDVAWSMYVDGDYDFPEEDYEEFMDPESYEQMEKKLPKLKKGERVKYSGTNAVIDFAKSFEYKKKGKIHIAFCDFSGTDLSNNTLDADSNAFETSFANTKINVDFSKGTPYRSGIYCCDLSNLNLTTLEFDIFDYMRGVKIISECTLTNTGVNFIFDMNSEWFKSNFGYEPKKDIYGNVFSFRNPTWKKEIFNYLPTIEGCFINGKKVLSKEEVRKLREEKLEEYRAYKKEITAPFEEQFKKDNIKL